MTYRDLNIDKGWTLFLDRDGVINTRIPDNYVLKWEHFEFLPGVFEAMADFAEIFGNIIIVTNQQGIGRGYMTEADLDVIHSNMMDEISANWGRVDAVYHSPHISENNHVDRKPNVGMALKAKKDFPTLDFRRSIMAGDSLSDMEFGHRLGMVNVLISEDTSLARSHPSLIDFWAYNLKELAECIKREL